MHTHYTNEVSPHPVSFLVLKEDEEARSKGVLFLTRSTCISTEILARFPACKVVACCQIASWSDQGSVEEIADDSIETIQLSAEEDVLTLKTRFG